MRTYYSYKYRHFGGGSLTSGIIGRLILANVIVFILELILPLQFTLLFALTPRIVVENFYFWQILTYMFMHGGFAHLFFNMLMLWLFGSTLESVMGGKRFLQYYITCGIGGAVLSFVFNYNNLIMGASGAIFGLYLAYAMMFPENYIYFQFLLPVKAKHLLIFLAVLQLALGVSGPSGIAYFAHLGGMAAGLLFFRREIANHRWFARAQHGWSKYSKRKTDKRQDHDSIKIDSILDKIHAKGYENLSATEKRILEHYSKKQKEESDEM